MRPIGYPILGNLILDLFEYNNAVEFSFFFSFCFIVGARFPLENNKKEVLLVDILFGGWMASMASLVVGSRG